jgi:hypothetical protein
MGAVGPKGGDMRMLLGIMTVACALAHPQASAAQDKWPSQPIKLLVITNVEHSYG